MRDTTRSTLGSAASGGSPLRWLVAMSREISPNASDTCSGPAMQVAWSEQQSAATATDLMSEDLFNGYFQSGSLFLFPRCVRSVSAYHS